MNQDQIHPSAQEDGINGQFPCNEENLSTAQTALDQQAGLSYVEISIASNEDVISAVSDQDLERAESQLLSNQTTDGLLDGVRGIFQNQGLTLVLGAGVSASCGAPSWTELLLRLHSRSLASTFSGNLSGLAEIYSSAIGADGPLISARFAAVNGSDDTAEFKNSVRGEIYQQINTEKSQLVKELARLSQCCEGRQGIKSILTYNYDVLLEEALDDIGREYVRPDKTGTSTSFGIPIRHVHGFLGREQLGNEWIILSERGYHKEYSDPFSWSNIIQLNAFRETSCIFVGLSMTDPNQRRLLEAARQTATPRHYCFLRKTSWKQIQSSLNFRWEERGRGAGRPAVEQKDQLEKRLKLTASLVDNSRASALQELGVHTIWYEDHSSLPNLIRQLRARDK
jgi:hypothetical protein